MRKRQFLVMPLLLSVSFSILGVIFIDPAKMIPEQSYTNRILWSGFFFLLLYLGSFIGMSVGLLNHRKYRIRRPARWPIAFLLAAVAVFGLGAGGQALFMRGQSSTIYHPSSVDVVLLLDDSSSMEWSHFDDSRKTAAYAIVDSMDENVRLQVYGFAGIEQEYSTMLTADEAGRQLLKQSIQDIDLTGSTNYDAALAQALDSLSSGGRENSNKAVIMITDGEGYISPETEDILRNSASHLFCLRITGIEGQSSEVGNLPEVAAETDGFDLVVQPDASGSVDIGSFLEAFQAAFAGTTEEIRVTPDGLLICEKEITSYQWFVRICTFLLCAVIIGIGCFGWLRVWQLLLDLLCGAVCAVAIYFFAGHYLIVAICTGVLLGAAVVQIEWEGGESDV